MSFSDDQLAAIRQLAEPIDRRDRSAFLSALTSELGRLLVVSGGDILRVGRDLQRSFLRGGASRDTSRLRAERKFARRMD
jgi:hypothetical protein